MDLTLIQNPKTQEEIFEQIERSFSLSNKRHPQSNEGEWWSSSNGKPQSSLAPPPPSILRSSSSPHSSNEETKVEVNYKTKEEEEVIVVETGDNLKTETEVTFTQKSCLIRKNTASNNIMEKLNAGLCPRPGAHQL